MLTGDDAGISPSKKQTVEKAFETMRPEILKGITIGEESWN